jgi:hypothetical protein
LLVASHVLPRFTKYGDLPPGVHVAGWREIEGRFGIQNPVRKRAAATLRLLHALARRTGCLSRFYVFGSFVSAIAEPRDVDVLLIMTRAFRVEDCAADCAPLFSHLQAQARYGASVFWLREGLLSASEMTGFLDAWQTKRGGAPRGIVEVA